MRGTFDAEIKAAIGKKAAAKGKKKMPFPMRKTSKAGEAVDPSMQMQMIKGKGGR